MGLKVVWPPRCGVRHSRLFILNYWQEKQTSHVPQICFAPNSGRKLLVTAATDFFLFRTSLKMTQSKDPEGDVAEAATESGWIKQASNAATTLAAEQQISSRSILQHISSMNTHASDLPVPGWGCWPLIKRTLIWCLHVCMSGDNYRRTRQIMSRVPAMQKSHKQATMTAALDSTWARAEGPGQSQQTMNIYFPPCVCPLDV